MMPTAALAAGLFFGTPAVAQVDLTFGVGIRAESDSNPGLTPVSGGQSSSIGLNLSFGLVSETASSSLTLNGSAGLTAASGTGSSGLTSPTLALAYTQTTAAADFTLNGSVQSGRTFQKPHAASPTAPIPPRPGLPPPRPTRSWLG